MEWSQTSDNVMTVRMQTTGPGWEQSFLELADVHFDSPYCDRGLLKSLLNEAMERGTPVAIFGDWNDVMQGRNDPRRSLKELRKSFAGAAGYADAVVDESVAFLKPYADIIMFISDGNHDTAARKNLETDIVERICKEIGVVHFGYAGFVRFMFERDTGGHRSTKTMFFHHGHEGGKVSKGTQRSARWQEWAVADIYIGGHIHSEWRINRPRVSIAPSGKEVIDETLHISLPTLKREWNLQSGYAIERAFAPAPIGGAWLRFEHHPRARNNIHADALRAR